MSNWFQRARRAITVMTLPMLLAACGGGTEQITPFEPQRYFVFGDEMSVLTGLKDPPLGRKYTVNGVGADGVTPDCAANSATQPSLLWTQLLGGNFGFVFAECNPAHLPVTAFSYAARGAKADDIAAQLAAAGAVHGLLTLGAATGFEALKSGDQIVSNFGLGTPILGIVVAAVTAAASVKWMVGYLQRHSFAVFGYYRLAAAAVTAVLLGLGTI